MNSIKNAQRHFYGRRFGIGLYYCVESSGLVVVVGGRLKSVVVVIVIDLHMMFLDADYMVSYTPGAEKY